MKALLRRIKYFLRSDFKKRGDALRAKSRAHVAKMLSEGRVWEGMRANAAQIGMTCNSSAGGGLKVVFGADRESHEKSG